MRGTRRRLDWLLLLSLLAMLAGTVNLSLSRAQTLPTTDSTPAGPAQHATSASPAQSAASASPAQSAASASPALSATPETASTPAQVVLLVLDTLRADRIEAVRNGVPLMPHLKALAAESRYYTRAISQSSWTRPAMASIFTSLYPDTHQVRYLPDPGAPEGAATGTLNTRFQTMASYLREAGFRTEAVQANPILTPEAGFAQGFDRYDAMPEATAEKVTEAALQAVARMDGRTFLYVQYMDPHSPYAPPEPFSRDARHRGATAQDLRSLAAFNPYMYDQLDHLFGGVPTRRFPALTPAGRDTAQALYDGEARFLDQQVGRLLKALRRQAPNAMVVVVSDHGEELWEHGAVGHGGTMYHEQVAVPLIVHIPGATPQRIDASVETLSILPTVAATLRLAPASVWQGMDLQARAGRDLPVFSHTRAISPRLNVDTEMIELGEHKLIVKHGQRKHELYDIVRDPGEQRNLAGTHRELEQALKAMLDRHRAENLEHLRRLDAERRTQLSDDTVRRLRSLGYLR